MILTIERLIKYYFRAVLWGCSVSQGVRSGLLRPSLDGAGRLVDSLSSIAGHLLWSGIFPAHRARLVADRLMGDDLFSGWGIRTMAAGEAGYDPDSYHNGSVWPHDNAIIAHGLSRYGFQEEANRIALALLEAAPRFDHRLPEVFAGRWSCRGPAARRRGRRDRCCCSSARCSAQNPRVHRELSSDDLRGLENMTQEKMGH